MLTVGDKLRLLHIVKESARNKPTIHKMKPQIEAILAATVPGAFSIVNQSRNSFSGTEEIKIGIAASNYEINRVKGQYPALVSLWLKLDTMELTVQTFGGMGGGCIYRRPNMEDAREKYLAMKGVKIPFRKPQPNEKAVLAAVERFALAWKKAVAENISNMSHAGIDYAAAIA